MKEFFEVFLLAIYQKISHSNKTEEMRKLLLQRPMKVRLQHEIRNLNSTLLVENDIDVQKVRKIRFVPSPGSKYNFRVEYINLSTSCALWAKGCVG